MSRFLMSAALAAAMIFLISPAGAPDTARAFEHHPFQQYTEVLEKVQAWYPGEIKGDELVYSSIDGMLDMLDPHSNFLDPKAYHSMQQRQVGRFSGLGIIVGMRNEKVTIISPIEGTPAYRLGIRAGDIIAAIDGKTTENMNIDDVVDLLRGPQGSEVTIGIRRLGVADPLPFTIKREVIPETSVRYGFMLDKETGYIRVTDFNRTTAQELGDQLSDLKGKGMARLVLDLRDNPGGVMEQAVEVADQFLKAGQMVVFTRGRDPSSFQEYRTPSKRPRLEIPVVILVNQGSASASEIVAGALQDHDRAVIAGETTFGKGLVQSVYELSLSTALALTTARYYTPSGRCIQRDYSNLTDYYRGVNGAAKSEEFKTDAGRKVYGGGGIAPDYIIKGTEVPLRQWQLQWTGAYFNFAVDYAGKAPVDPKAFAVDDALADQFTAYLVKENQLTPEDAKEIRKSEAEARVMRFLLKREILSAKFGMTQGYQSVIKDDEQLSQALAHFDQASDLARAYFSK
jgi:carboxyl-terminal processing protease